jgi:hypothetical protein
MAHRAVPVESIFNGRPRGASAQPTAPGHFLEDDDKSTRSRKDTRLPSQKSLSVFAQTLLLGVAIFYKSQDCRLTRDDLSAKKWASGTTAVEFSASGS